MNVADERVAFGAKLFEPFGEIAEEAGSFVRIGDTIGADVDNGGAGLDPIGFDVAGLAHGGDDDVRAAHDIGQVARFRMANGHRGIGVHEEKCHGFADYVAAAEDDGVGAFDLDIVAA